MKTEYQRVKRELDRTGILLLSDAELPNIVGLIAGEPVRGSWWGHAKGNLIFNISQNLMDEPDVLTVKLVNQKVTYLKKEHWSALYSVATSGESWQKNGLTRAHLDLIKQIEKKKSLRADDASLKLGPAEIGKLANKLEEKILVYSESLHTESGKHVRLLMTWDEMFKTKKFKPKQMSYESAIEHFSEIFAGYEFEVNLPWGKIV